jgi:ABC-2 type transport system permease protein
MTAALHYAALTLRLNLRNPMAVIYGYLFPLVFLLAFAVIYRNDPAPLISHLGALLTVTALGGACFGLPTAIVSERERGVWRRYRATPAPVGVFIGGLVVSRLVLLLSAGAIQLAIAAVALGMPLPNDPAGLALAFIAVSCALIGLGMIVAMVANSVPAVQALGQCIFLPMLMIGGVAVPISSLPRWIQAVSAFVPGRYAVSAMQSTATGGGIASAGFALMALALFALSSSLIAASLFRWDTARRRPSMRLLGLGLALWLAIGLAGTTRGVDRAGPTLDNAPITAPAAYARPPASPPPKAPSRAAETDTPRPAPASWRDIGDEAIATIAFDRLPSDEGLVSPMARRGTLRDTAAEQQIAAVRAALPHWPPASAADPVQRTRNLLYIAAVPDVLQMDPLERHLPWLVFDRLRQTIPPQDLPRILFWISQHPDEGSDAAVERLGALGLPEVSGPTDRVRERTMIYALKFLQRIEQAQAEAQP